MWYFNVLYSILNFNGQAYGQLARCCNMLKESSWSWRWPYLPALKHLRSAENQLQAPNVRVPSSFVYKSPKKRSPKLKWNLWPLYWTVELFVASIQRVFTPLPESSQGWRLPSHDARSQQVWVMGRLGKELWVFDDIGADMCWLKKRKQAQL